MVSKRTQVLLAVPIAVIVAATGVLLRKDMPTSIPAESPIRIDIQISGHFLHTNEGYKVSITNQTDCAAVNEALRFGRKESPHACIALGTMTLHYASGSSNVIGIGAGHNDSRYEFGRNELYSIPRAKLAEAITRAGIDKSKLLLGN